MNIVIETIEGAHVTASAAGLAVLAVGVGILVSIVMWAVIRKVARRAGS